MYSEVTHNELNIEGDWSHDLSAINLLFEPEGHEAAYELIPADDSGTLASRMGVLLLAVTGITITLVWLLYGGAAGKSSAAIVEPSLPYSSYPTPTLIGPVLAETGALAARADHLAANQAALLPTQTPIPTPIPTPEFGFYPDSAIAKQYVTAKMKRDLDAIIRTDFPPRDYLATHLLLTELVPPQPISAAVWQIGQRREINAGGEKVGVWLAAAGANAYIWVDERLPLTSSQFDPIVTRIDNQLYPAVTALFGEERRPGIDNDPRFHIFHLAHLDSRELGYFDSSDAYPTEVFAESNEHEAIYLNMNSMTLESDVYYGTLVHELQHLIQWHVDRNETTWLDEGLSQLSEVYAGFKSFSVDDYTRNNHIQLNNWSYDSETLHSHYGGSALFVVYLWEQFGDRFIQTLAASRYDGMAAVVDALASTPGQPTLDDVFRDWLAAVYLNDAAVAEAKYGFSRYEFTPPQAHQVALANSSTPFSTLQTRPQFSGWYVELPSNQTVTVSFAGDTVQTLFAPIPNQPEGNAFFAPPRNRVDSTLQKWVDLRGVADATLTFDSWFDLEEGYDHAYLMVSADNGANWISLATAEMKQGTYGAGFSGQSAGWITQSVSLSRWAGEQILVRFHVLTDSAVPANGFAVDNITISSEGVTADFEFDAGGWEPQGFVRTGNLIPQKWTVSVVQQRPDGSVDVQPLEVDDYGELQQTVTIGDRGSLIIAPISPFTTRTADFWFSVR